MIKYGSCECGKWGEAPKEFRENKHFLKCPACGKAMYLTVLITPQAMGMKESDKVVITEFIRHNG